MLETYEMGWLIGALYKAEDGIESKIVEARGKVNSNFTEDIELVLENGRTITFLKTYPSEIRQEEN